MLPTPCCPHNVSQGKGHIDWAHLSMQETNQTTYTWGTTLSLSLSLLRRTQDMGLRDAGMFCLLSYWTGEQAG